MLLNDKICYRALSARDARFDGLFFVGVTTTGIYCRPVCTARTPRPDRCRFFASAALAEREGFRPCLRCRPELAPGLAPVDAVNNLARRAAARIDSGALNDGRRLEDLAAELGTSSRHLRRAVRQEFGVSPIELAQTRRLLLAKQLLTDSSLPMLEVAFASGFASLRRFNALFRLHYGMPPTRLRRARRAIPSADRIRLTLSYRPPLAWNEMLQFLARRSTAGVECVSGGKYRRTLASGNSRGWLTIEPAHGRDALIVELPTLLSRELPVILAAVRQTFDLSARSDVIDAHLTRTPELGDLVRRTPGLRVPGAFDGFELAVRAILGQQVTVAAASTMAGRLASRFGESIETPFADLNRLSPSAERLAAVRVFELTDLGITESRAQCIRTLARAVADRQICFDRGADPDQAIRQLMQIPGIGDWTANYIALRALRWPDAFPSGDLALIKRVGASTAAELRSAAEVWRPWRGYAAMHFWNSSVEPVSRSQSHGDRLLPSVSQPDRIAAADVGRTIAHGAVSARSPENARTAGGGRRSRAAQPSR
jgi:AraC family transcriptional regulator of adaptative response / DNA-3-methyladenine glycosylase II